MYYFLLSISLLIISPCNIANNQNTSENTTGWEQKAKIDLSKYERAYFASGCFWCVEAIFESVKGVTEAISGYAGGSAESAIYSKVSAGVTNHAEAVAVYYDPQVIDYSTLLEVFFGSHDPTTLNRQGPDHGRQYRSAIFYQNEEEKKLAQAYIEKLTKGNVFKAPITTTLEALDEFFPAEEYHQDFEKNNPNHPYVRSVSIPRLQQFQLKYPHLLKENMK